MEFLRKSGPTPAIFKSTRVPDDCWRNIGADSSGAGPHDAIGFCSRLPFSAAIPLLSVWLRATPNRMASCFGPGSHRTLLTEGECRSIRYTSTGKLQPIRKCAALSGMVSRPLCPNWVTPFMWRLTDCSRRAGTGIASAWGARKARSGGRAPRRYAGTIRTGCGSDSYPASITPTASIPHFDAWRRKIWTLQSISATTSMKAPRPVLCPSERTCQPMKSSRSKTTAFATDYIKATLPCRPFTRRFHGS